MSPAAIERRRSRRLAISVPATLQHALSGRQFPARTIDASAAGLKLCTPMSLPASPGQDISLRLDRIDSPELEGLQGELAARIVRVDRSELTTAGQLILGIEFAGVR